MDDIYRPVKKIIMGAQNSYIKQIRQLLKIYTKVGANMFDVSANVYLIKKTLKVLTKFKIQSKPLLCVSITLENDIHANKAQICTKKCESCNACVKVCPQNAITTKNKTVHIIEKRCSGCGKCIKACSSQAIEMKYLNKSFDEQFSKIKYLNIDCIEIHTNGKNGNLYYVFERLKNEFSGIIGLCIANNDNLEEKIRIIERVKEIIYPKKLLLQADGSAISGFDNLDTTTQKALEECKNLSCIKDIYLIPSGGVNAKTYKLAKEQNIKIDGVAIGSYARKIVSPYISSRKIKKKNYKKALKEAYFLINSIN